MRAWIRNLAVVAGLMLGSHNGWAEEFAIDPADLAPPARVALEELQRAVSERRAARSDRGIDRNAAPVIPIVPGLIGDKKIDDLLGNVKVGDTAESFAIQKCRGDQRSALLLAGRDARGLAYAIHEIARVVRTTPVDGNPLAAVKEANETPFLAVRAISVHLFNADLEESWYFDEAYWRDYFTMLASQRFNRFTLTFCDQTNYLCPLYSNLLKVPGFPDVRVKGVTELDQFRQLLMLKKISDLAAEYGLDFTLGIWQQVPVPAYPPKVEVEGLPEGVKAADYCAAGLKAVLKACPSIRGVQLRMNAEAGVKETEQTAFYTPLFHAIRDCGRPVFVELRYKGLQPETTKAALDAGLDVAVSTKYWSEHFGLPFHQTVVDSHYRKDRYSYGDVLEHPRKYKVIFQHWTAGSQRLTVWGDPEYAATFAKSIKAVGGDGFEVFAPLTNRGYGNAPGKWEMFLHRKETAIQEQQRYWFFYLSFGRLGFNPQADSDTWQR